MRSTRNTVGGVFAAITAGISLVMAIWDVVSWIMTMSLGNIFAGRPFLSFFVALFQESIFDFGDTQMHLLFAGTMLFFVIGACVNFLAAIVLLKRGSNHKGASITLGIINEVGIIFWIIFSGRAGFYVGKYIIGNSHIYLRWWLEERCRRNARNADAHICIRMRTLWIPGSVPHCGRSPHLDGRIRHRSLSISILQMFW